MSNDWYARKLAELRGAPPAAAPPPAPGPAQYPPTQPLAPGQLPAHLAPYAYAQQAPQAPHQPQQPMEHQPPPQQQFTTYDANTGAQVADDGFVAQLVNAASTGGSSEVKSNSTQCPNCGGGNYFTIAGGGIFSKVTGGKVSPMECADCNYPNIQAGSHGGTLGSARSSGPAKAARQLPANHRVTVLDGSQAVTFEPPTGAR